jgi:hypothetical protein
LAMCVIWISSVPAPDAARRPQPAQLLGEAGRSRRAPLSPPSATQQILCDVGDLDLVGARTGRRQAAATSTAARRSRQI